MAQAKAGDNVKVHYTGKLDDGTVFDTSEGRDPLAFKLGEGRVIPGFEQGIEGMATGDVKTIKIAAADAYGPVDASRVLQVPRKDFPADLAPEVGQQLQVGQEGGPRNVVTVTAVSDESVTLDANHPLAGKDLTFDVELVEIA